MRGTVARVGALVMAGFVLVGAAAAGPAAGGDGGKPAGEALPVIARWERFGRAEGLPSDRVTAVACARGRVYAGTEAGLAVREEDGTWKTYGPEDGLAHEVVSATAIDVDPDTGDVWIGTLGGLSRYSGGEFRSWTQLSSGLVNDVIFGVTVALKKVWVGTPAGLSVYDPSADSWAIYNNDNTLMHEPWVYGVSKAPDRIYVAVWGGGVLEHDPVGGTWKAYRDPDGEGEVDLIRDDGPISNVVAGVAIDEGVLWAASYLGLSRYDGRRWRAYRTEDGVGLPSNFVNTVKARGRTGWIATDDGLAATDGDRWVVYRPGPEGSGEVEIRVPGREVERRRTETGISNGFVFSLAFDGEDVWVATADGLAHGIAR